MDNETLLLALPDKSEAEMERFFAEKAIRENPEAVLSSVVPFEKAVYVFNDLKPNFTTFEPLNTLCNAKAVHEIKKILPDWEFNSEINYYLAYIAWGEGWVKMPDVLSFAQTELDKIAPAHQELDEEQKKFQMLRHAAAEKYMETDK